MMKYPKYKPSNVEWIGDIPEHWGTNKIKNLSSIISKGTTPSTIGKEVSDIGEIRYLKSENIIDNSISEYPEFFIDKETNEILKRSILLEGDILFVIAGASIGKTCILPKNFSPSNTNQAVSFVRLKNNQNNRFIWYWLVSSKIQEQMWIVSVQSAQPNLSMENLGNFYVPYPPIQEQQQIVQFLDEKTELIDKLISTKERKIDLLKQQRTSLINEVITKGLNPKVKLKNSGVEWIGEIPEHWEVSKVKYITEIFGRIGYRGYTLEDIVVEGEGVITISPSNIQNDIFTIDGSNTYISFEKYYQSPEIMIFTDDIILVKTGSTIGKTSIIPKGVPEMTINPQLIVLKNIKINNNFLYYQTICDFFKISFFVEQTGSSTPTISQEKINSFPILIPTIKEQEKIVEYLDTRTKEIDDLILMEQQKINLLKEYRQSLISEVITGKIDVRNNLN